MACSKVAFLRTVGHIIFQMFFSQCLLLDKLQIICLYSLIILTAYLGFKHNISKKNVL